MNPIAACAESTLRQHPHPALRLPELVELVAERIDRTLDEARLRAILEGHPERFRVLDPWKGVWRTTPHPGGTTSRRRDVWVVAIQDPGDPPAELRPVALKLRESVRWLGRGIDPRSRTEVSRWHAMALAERAARAA